MAVRSRQIGWSPMANALYDVLREMNALKGQFAATPTTTTTTTPAPIDTLVSINLGGISGEFDIPYNKCSFGCWINMANDAGFPRLFSFGQYPTAGQAISIEGGLLFFWYNGSVVFTHSLSEYIGNWKWVSVIGASDGSVTLAIDGFVVASGTAASQAPSIPENLYIGSENAPDTYYDGLMAGIIFDNANIDLLTPPTTPFTPDPASTVLLFGQGGTLLEQTTDLGIYSRPIAYSNLSYSTSSPYSPAAGGSLKFGV